MYRRVRHADGPKGVILADDMGLGKTVQTIALLLALLNKKGVYRYVIWYSPVVFFCFGEEG